MYVRNLLRDPSTEAYRRILTSNATVRAMRKVTGVDAFILAAGWENRPPYFDFTFPRAEHQSVSSILNIPGPGTLVPAHGSGEAGSQSDAQRYRELCRELTRAVVRAQIASGRMARDPQGHASGSSRSSSSSSSSNGTSNGVSGSGTDIPESKDDSSPVASAVELTESEMDTFMASQELSRSPEMESVNTALFEAKLEVLQAAMAMLQQGTLQWYHPFSDTYVLLLDITLIACLVCLFWVPLQRAQLLHR